MSSIILGKVVHAEIQMFSSNDFAHLFNIDLLNISYVLRHFAR